MALVEKKDRAELRRVLGNGLRGRCPRCGQGKLFRTWHFLNESCSFCACAFEARSEHTWFFMYMSAGLITGTYIIAMFLFTPTSQIWGRIAIGLSALVLFFLTNRPRKGLAIALEYFIDSHSEFPKHP